MSDDLELDTEINKRDIKDLEDSLAATKESVDQLDRRIRGNGDTDGILSRLVTLETKVKGLIVGAGLIATAVVGQLVANVL